jgi:hypothetical protein
VHERFAAAGVPAESITCGALFNERNQGSSEGVTSIPATFLRVTVAV